LKQTTKTENQNNKIRLMLSCSLIMHFRLFPDILYCVNIIWQRYTISMKKFVCFFLAIFAVTFLKASVSAQRQCQYGTRTVQNGNAVSTFVTVACASSEICARQDRTETFNGVAGKHYTIVIKCTTVFQKYWSIF